MALTRIGGWRDFLLGAIIPDPTSGGKGTVDIQAVLITDSAGNEITSSVGSSTSRATADKQIKAGAGTIYTMSVSPTGAVVAGVLTIYDSLTETGTVLYSVSLPTTTFTPFTVTFNAPFVTGLYCGFDATLANVQATFSYR